MVIHPFCGGCRADGWERPDGSAWQALQSRLLIKELAIRTQICGVSDAFPT
jgi:hypothetical protein